MTWGFLYIKRKSGEEHGTPLALDKERIAMGRSVSCQILLKLPQVEPVHVVLSSDGMLTTYGQVEFNGVLYAGGRKLPLADCDTFTIAGRSFKYRTTSLQQIQPTDPQVITSSTHKKERSTTPTQQMSSDHNTEQLLFSPKKKATPVKKCTPVAVPSILQSPQRKKRVMSLGAMIPSRKVFDSPALRSQLVAARKNVKFGVQLSPEIFDKNKPSNTPVKRGGTPVKYGGSVLKSIRQVDASFDLPVSSSEDLSLVVNNTMGLDAYSYREVGATQDTLNTLDSSQLLRRSSTRKSSLASQIAEEAVDPIVDHDVGKEVVDLIAGHDDVCEEVVEEVKESVEVVAIQEVEVSHDLAVDLEDARLVLTEEKIEIAQVEETGEKVMAEDIVQEVMKEEFIVQQCVEVKQEEQPVEAQDIELPVTQLPVNNWLMEDHEDLQKEEDEKDLLPFEDLLDKQPMDQSSPDDHIDLSEEKSAPKMSTRGGKVTSSLPKKVSSKKLPVSVDEPQIVTEKPKAKKKSVKKTEEILQKDSPIEPKEVSKKRGQKNKKGVVEPVVEVTKPAIRRGKKAVEQENQEPVVQTKVEPEATRSKAKHKEEVAVASQKGKRKTAVVVDQKPVRVTRSKRNL